MHNVHEPYQAPQRFKDMYSAEKYCSERLTLQAMVSVADELVFNLTTKLERMGVMNNTLLVFGSDNGGDPYVGGNAPFKVSILVNLTMNLPRTLFHWNRS